MIPVILSGGSGERLWPLSRRNYPKPFLKLFENSLFEQTMERVPAGSDLIVVASESQKVLVNKGLKARSPGSHALFEPQGRNTAPAVALACRFLEAQGRSDEVIALLAADHFIQDQAGFAQALKKAETSAKEDFVVTLGIAPDHPATGYGYIKVAESKLGEASAVESFVEKPDLAKAKSFLADGHYFWNAGIFIAKASTLIGHFKEHQPKLWSKLAELKEFSAEELGRAYEQIESLSFDVGIMEKISAAQVRCIPVDIGWSDLGSWDAVAEAQSGGENKQQVNVESKNVFVKAHRDRSYAFLGVDDLIVVDTADALLVAHKDKLAGMKELVAKIRSVQPSLTEEHVFEDRPWGNYEILRDEPHYKSKVIQVDGGQQISYQSHEKREEHWVVVRGSGEVVLNDEVIPVERGTYIHIPTQAKHRIRNTGEKVLEFIEVQIGEYFGEDDITRYEDDYARK